MSVSLFRWDEMPKPMQWHLVLRALGLPERHRDGGRRIPTAGTHVPEVHRAVEGLHGRGSTAIRRGRDDFRYGVEFRQRLLADVTWHIG